MAKYIKLTVIFCLFTFFGIAQNDTINNQGLSSIFDRIATGVKDFQLDTTSAPNDKITNTIIELRSLRGGFNINEAVDYKIQEDRQKKEIPKEELDKLETFFKTGNGKRWLDNATIWIYRQHFTYKELKRLVKFYKTSAGQKMATDFPVIMMQSLRAAELIKDIFANLKNK
jgi:hypothetical protein